MSSLLQRERKQYGEPVAAAETDGRTVTESPLFRLGRILFGVVLAFTATDNLRNLVDRVQYAESKDAPVPSLSVPATSGGLLIGGIGLALWRVPASAAAAVATFFAAATPVIHDFWNVDDPELQQQEFFHFAKNAALLGAALAFLKLALSEQSRE